MADNLGWLRRVPLVLIRSLARRLLDLLTPSPKRPFTTLTKGRIRLRKGDLEITWDWSKRHDQH